MAISDPTLLENLDVRQRQSLIGRELSLWRIGAKQRAVVTLRAYPSVLHLVPTSHNNVELTLADSLEMLLLLLWQHLRFYGEGKHLDNPDTKGVLAHTLRFAASPDVDTLRSEAARRIAPALQRLQTLDLVSDLYCCRQ